LTWNFIRVSFGAPPFAFENAPRAQRCF
jgi:hypothetical protein